MKRKFFFDMLLNIIATSIPTVFLQLLILPSLAKVMTGDEYGLVVTVLAVLNVIPSTIGNVLNNVRLLHEEEYKKINAIGDFQFLLLLFQGINFIVMVFISCYYLGVDDLLGIILLVVTGLLYLGREYYIVTFRLKLDYIAILLNNLCLVLGYTIGYLLLGKLGYWQIIYLLGYLFSYVYIAFKSSILVEPFCKTSLFKTVTKDCVFLLTANVLARSINYADKMLLYPLMGGTMVSIYYAATVFGKVVGLAITPINSVALSYLSKIEKKPDSLFRLIYIIGSIISIVGYFIAILLSKPALTILYPKYVDEAMKYIYITSATISVSVLTSIITPFVLRYFDIKWQIFINAITTFGYILISVILLKLGGLTGFCLGALAANIIKLLMTTFIFLKKSEKENIRK